MHVFEALHNPPRFMLYAWVMASVPRGSLARSLIVQLRDVVIGTI